MSSFKIRPAVDDDHRPPLADFLIRQLGIIDSDIAFAGSGWRETGDMCASHRVSELLLHLEFRSRRPLTADSRWAWPLGLECCPCRPPCPQSFRSTHPHSFRETS